MTDLDRIRNSLSARLTGICCRVDADKMKEMYTLVSFARGAGIIGHDEAVETITRFQGKFEEECAAVRAEKRRQLMALKEAAGGG